MADLFGLLFTLPTESVAVRAAVGSLVAVALTALLLRSVVTLPRIRSAAALIPLAAMIGAVVASWGELQLPTLMMPSEAESSLGPFLVRDTYVRFAPIAWPLLAIWVVVVGLRLSRRSAVMRRMRLLARAGAPPRDMRVRPLANHLATTMHVPTPRIVVVDGCPGGAALVGIRRPTLVVDATILSSLDEQELEGLLAHELAHVRRRDNLLALVVCLVRDVFFFVPGGRWMTRRLCAERELAADHVAVGATGRPAALASGLLKALDARRADLACAAFAAPAAVVGRVERLIADRPSGGLLRPMGETAALAGVLAMAVVAAVQIPATVASHVTEEGWGRDALAVLWAWGPEPVAEAVAESTVFDVYRRSTPYAPQASTGSAQEPHGIEFTPALLRGDRSLDPVGPAVHTRATAVNAWRDAELLQEWRATPLVAGTEGLGVYWLHELRTPH